MRNKPDGDCEEVQESTVSIRTPRLLIRRPCDADRDVVAVLAANPGIARNLTATPGCLGENQGETFTIVKRHTGTVVGLTGYGAMAGRVDALEIATWIGEEHWGRGYATEATHAVIDRAFRETGISLLWCSTRVANSRARRVIEKCGFQFRETGMMRSPATLGAMPVERFVLDRRNWASLKSWGAETRDNAA